MKRFILVVVPASFFLLMLLALAYTLRTSPAAPADNRMVRARSLFHTENYLSALEMLRDVPPGQKNDTEARSYLGAAYLHLHLYQAAIEEFQAAADQSPRALDPAIGLASAYIRLGDGSHALEQAARAAEIGENSIEAWLMLGRANWLQRNFSEAEKAALKVQELEPSDPEAAELLLHIYFDQNETDKFQSVLDHTSNPGKPIQDLAVQFFLRRGEFRRAYEFQVRFQRRTLEREILESELALAREPERSDVYPLLIRNAVKLGRAEYAIAKARAYRGPVSVDLELGQAYAMTGNSAEAIRAYERASGGRSHQLSAEVALAALTREKRHWQQAFAAERIEKDYFVLAQLEDVLMSASPIEKAFIYRYAGVYDPQFYNKAAEQALAILNDQPTDFDALMTIGTAYHRLGRIDDAIRYMEQAEQAYPNRAEPKSRMGSLALAKSDGERALPYIEKAALLEPSNSSYLYNYGWILDQAGRPREAMTFYERAIAASPLSFEAMNNLALLHAASGRTDLALSLLTRAVQVNPEHEAAYLNLADYHARQHAWTQALENYRRVQKLDPAHVQAAIESGRIYLELGRTEDAIEQLNQALEIDSHAFDAYMILSSVYERMGHNREAIAALDEAKRIRPDAAEIKSAMDRLKASVVPANAE